MKYLKFKFNLTLNLATLIKRLPVSPLLHFLPAYWSTTLFSLHFGTSSLFIVTSSLKTTLSISHSFSTLSWSGFACVFHWCSNTDNKNSCYFFSLCGNEWLFTSFFFFFTKTFLCSTFGTALLVFLLSSQTFFLINSSWIILHCVWSQDDVTVLFSFYIISWCFSWNFMLLNIQNDET